MQSDYERCDEHAVKLAMALLCLTVETCLVVQVYTLGTILSMQISFVGFQPVQSSEHMAVSG